MSSNDNSDNGRSEPAPKRLNDQGDSDKETGASSTIEELVMQTRAEADKFKNEYLYLLAEFENFKKHAVKERSDLRKYGCEALIRELLSVLDIFETALSIPTTAENFENFRKGIELTASNLRSSLQKFGVEEVAALGQRFDPSSHEALSSEESSDIPEGHISQVFKKSYRLHDRVIRPAQVVVAKAKVQN